jgi:hypothetical protein
MTFEQIQLRDSIPLDIITAEQWRAAIAKLQEKQTTAVFMGRLIDAARMIALKAVENRA